MFHVLTNVGAWRKKTSLWKLDDMSGELYTEFDCLAVLKNMPRTCFDTGVCKGCVLVHELPVNYTALKKYYAGTVLSDRETYVDGVNFDILFVKEIDTSLRSLCSCTSVGYNDPRQTLISKQRNMMVSGVFGKSCTSGCDMCVVKTPTGSLRVNPSKQVVREIDNKGPEKCSLILHWTSKANSVLGFDPILLGQLQSISSLSIYVDFLPTLELFKQNAFARDSIWELPVPFLSSRNQTADLFCQNLYGDDPTLESVNQQTDLTLGSYKPLFTENSVRTTRQIHVPSVFGESSEHECFIVPKSCCVCGNTYPWRKSSSRSEIAYIVNEMSEKHRRCYMVLKYLLSFADRHLNDVNSYHIKTIAMHHSKKCSVASRSCAECVLEMLNDLLAAF